MVWLIKFMVQMSEGLGRFGLPGFFGFMGGWQVGFNCLDVNV